MRTVTCRVVVGKLQWVKIWTGKIFRIASKTANSFKHFFKKKLKKKLRHARCTHCEVHNRWSSNRKPIKVFIIKVCLIKSELLSKTEMPNRKPKLSKTEIPNCQTVKRVKIEKVMSRKITHHFRWLVGWSIVAGHHNELRLVGAVQAATRCSWRLDPNVMVFEVDWMKLNGPVNERTTDAEMIGEQFELLKLLELCKQPNS